MYVIVQKLKSTIVFYTFFSERLPRDFFNKELSVLPSNIRAKIHRFQKWQDAHACLLGNLLLKKIIDYYGMNYSLEELCYTEFRKPYFLSDSFNFNISHSENYVVCAASNEVRLGIDIEKIKEIRISDFKDQFHVEEWKEILDSNQQLRVFYEFWTRKEAVTKADGRGLNIALEEINLLEIPNRVKVEGTEWMLKTVPVSSSYQCAIASSKQLNSLKPVLIKYP